MDNISICISFIVAIFGIAYPILLEVVSRLDEKYSSLIILDLFHKERERKAFNISLIATLSCVLLWILKLPILIDMGYLSPYLGRSAEFLLILSTAGLAITFFLFVRKILIYYTPTTFLPYLIRKHDKNPEAYNYQAFRAISDVLYFSVKTQSEAIAKTISTFMYGAFKQVRNVNQTTEVIYPAPYYEVVSKTIEELATVRNRRLAFLSYRTAGGVWLLGELNQSKISENTYQWIWSNLQLALSYDRDDFIIYQWEQSFQFIRSALDYIRPEYSNDSYEIINQSQIDERIAQRKRFLELHYALGGLLLYTGKLDCIKRMFTYTQSFPPQYELLPATMDEIFSLYFAFRDPYEMRHPWISHEYPFPDTSGTNADGIIKKWICEYIAVLFLRQYSIVPHLITMKPLAYPTIPPTQAEKRQWIDNLDYFKFLVENVLKDNELLRALNLDFVTDEWCERNDYPKPLTFIDNVKEGLLTSFEGTLIDQTLSEQRVQKFKETSNSLLKPVLNEYDVLNNTDTFDGELNKRYISGLSHIIDKSGLADNQDADYVDFDSFLPQGFIEKYQNAISEIFVLASTQTYLLNAQDIIPGLQKLNLNPNEYLIISFGVGIEELISQSNDTQLKNIEIINFGVWNYHLVGDSLFILKKSDLPKLNYKEISEKEVQKYTMEKVLSEYNLYLAVVDLNRSEELRNAFEESHKDRDLRKTAFMGIFINLEIQWKKGVECIQIKQSSPFRESGIINKVSDVKPISDKPSTSNH